MIFENERVNENSYKSRSLWNIYILLRTIVETGIIAIICTELLQFYSSAALFYNGGAFKFNVVMCDVAYDVIRLSIMSRQSK